MSEIQEFEAEVERLLSETVEEARIRERNRWPLLRRGLPERIVIHGMGRLGQRVLGICRQQRIDVVAFCDRAADSGPIGSIKAVPVFGVAEAAARFGRDCTFISAIWSGTAVESVRERMEHLRALGCAHVVSFPALLWTATPDDVAFHGFSRPSFFLHHAAELRWLWGELQDVPSREIFVGWLRRLLMGEFSATAVSVPQYFPVDVIALGPGESVCDVGAFNGDTLRSFLQLSQGRFDRYHAFEPDQVSCTALSSMVQTLSSEVRSRIRIYPTAVGRRVGRVGYASRGTPTSGVDPGAVEEVSQDTLDTCLAGHRLTFLKMDVEGSEADVLEGGKNLIAGAQPSVAACVYHRPDDPWRIARTLRALLPKHTLHLRSHGHDGWETVLYAVAPHHVAAANKRGSAA